MASSAFHLSSTLIDRSHLRLDAMEFEIWNVHTQATVYDVTKAIADQVLHKCPGLFVTDSEQRLPNFQVVLNANDCGGVRNNGNGTFTVTKATGKRFNQLNVRREISVIVKEKKLKFRPTREHVSMATEMTLEKAPFIDPDIERQREEKLVALQDGFVVCRVQIGTFYCPDNTGHRAFSIEWEKDLMRRSMAWLNFEYDHKLMRIEIGDSTTEPTRYSVVVNFDNIYKLGMGCDFAENYICFDLLRPPVFQQEEMHRPQDIGCDKKFRQRVGELSAGHGAVAPYAHHLRVVLFDDSDAYKGDILDRFAKSCVVAGLRPPKKARIDARKREFFTSQNLNRVSKWLGELRTNWRVTFQIEALLRNGSAHTLEVLALRSAIDNLIHDYGDRAGEIMRYFAEAAANRPTVQPLQECFQTVLQRKLRRRRFTPPPGHFSCHHVTFTPTRLLLEGPDVTQSNRVIRDFEGYEDYFLRVSFRDEDRLHYRWTRDVDSESYLQGRVGKVLKEGFDLAGRHFDFLGYSSSALRSHTVWFVSPFRHPEKGWVTARSIRASLGDFREVIYSPSKYGARMAQAFTATDPSVRLHEFQWSEIPDIEERGIVFTDGIGTISQGLARWVWQTLCENWSDHGENAVQPTAYQIRFLGYKGMVSVDPNLEGIHMCLRPSMKKFDVPGKDYADIEIASAFTRPKRPNLNRPLITVLEDRGAPRQAFLDLQNNAVADARRAHESAAMFSGLLEKHRLCKDFWLTDTLRRLNALGLELNPNRMQRPLDTPFLSRIRSSAINHVLRGIKYRARIPIPESYMLPGVADEGPAYVNRGYKNVYCLPQGKIFACIQNPGDEEPTWIKGMCLISRSPVIHPGDVQRVYAIGKPPEDQMCVFAKLKNVVVFAARGTQSLPNSLGGGDLDGDLYEVMQYGPLLVPEHHNPAAYPSTKPYRLDRPSTIHDVCDFIVEYINSDVVGLVSDKHIVIADQSKDGSLDSACLKLAELHSRAVDYPKNGNKVELHHLPRSLVAFKPDWHESEQSDQSNNRKVDYYESSRALGYLYRNIKLEELPNCAHPGTESALSKSISSAFQRHVQRKLRGYVPREGQFLDIDTVYAGYREELRYISTTYSLSKTALTEEELVIGEILANCSNERYRRDRVYAMKESLSFLLRITRQDLVGELNGASDEDLRGKLARAWDAWSFSQDNEGTSIESGNSLFGLRSFGLVALGLLLECLARLGSLPPL
ncbi:RNA dependent RNA polymerase-domain-containing protein [Pisolithus orientalis]|uniref:RNA dependent RNA polymerase-domain-containing protein n=1 Tax=Pisolithus orientalis TaxID=936130 RepID=UPI0022254894|nr:RNA dependent RNA polymerase-domain-containing protein [Pisolithus orientalis]KAI5995827.1 RNA dependent RNA polymerase-domain-containing protein [Pisolithus orientalis]